MDDQTNNPSTPAGKPGSNNDYQTIDAFLTDVSVAISNSSHTEIAPFLLDYGYSPALIAIGSNLLAKAVNLHQTQMKEYGEKFDATDKLHESLDAANGMYTKHLAVARVAFKGQRGILSQLSADGERKRSQSGWLGQAKSFYKNMLDNSEFLKSMAKYGQTEAKLTAANEAVLKVEIAIAKKQNESGEAQTATQKRDQALEELSNWNSDFTEIARIALKETPHLLEILGIKQAA